MSGEIGGCESEMSTILSMGVEWIGLMMLAFDLIVQ